MTIGVNLYQTSREEPHWAWRGSVPAPVFEPIALAGSEALEMTIALAQLSLDGGVPIGQNVAGEQAVPRPMNVAAHPAAEVVAVQSPFGAQQAPPQGLGAHTVPKPWKVLPAAVQPAGVPDGAKVTEQLPAGAQQAPITAVQELGVQVVPSPRNDLVESQSTTRSVEHAPVLEQQAPRRASQELVGEQVEPAPLNTCVAPAHELAVVTQQAAKNEQHAPMPGQGVARQVVPGPVHVLPAAVQPAWVRVVHVVFVELQHAPRRAVQGLEGWQAVPSPSNVLAPVQLAPSVMEQSPVLEQQAPLPGHGLTYVHAVPMPWKWPRHGPGPEVTIQSRVKV